MTTGDDPTAIRARTAAFVAAGRPPTATRTRPPPTGRRWSRSAA